MRTAIRLFVTYFSALIVFLFIQSYPALADCDPYYGGTCDNAGGDCVYDSDCTGPANFCSCRSVPNTPTPAPGYTPAPTTPPSQTPAPTITPAPPTVTPGYAADCSPLVWKCDSGGNAFVRIPGSYGTNCSTQMVSSASGDYMTIRSVDSSGNDCAWDWSSDPYGGLAVWETFNNPNWHWTGEDPSEPRGHHWLGYTNGNFDPFSSNAVIRNGQASVSFITDTTVPHQYVVAPGCVTAWGNNDWKANWDAIRGTACYRIVDYTPVSTVPPAPTFTHPSCISSSLQPSDTSVTISWTPVNPAVTWVDIDIDEDWSNNNYYHKAIPSGTTTTAPYNFGYFGLDPLRPQQLAIHKGITYFVRTFNGQHSNVTSFRIPPCVTPTPLPTCTIQGFRTATTDSNLTTAKVYLDGVSQGNSNPYSITVPGNSTHSISVDVPTDYTVASTSCTNNTNCHNPGDASRQYTNSRDVTCPAGGYVDLWWHYNPPPSTSTAACISAAITNPNADVQISWSDKYLSGNGGITYVDISNDPTFPANNFYNKSMAQLSPSTNAPVGFTKFNGTGNLIINPNQTYQTRLWNGYNHSVAKSFLIPSCPPSSVTGRIFYDTVTADCAMNPGENGTNEAILTLNQFAPVGCGGSFTPSTFTPAPGGNFAFNNLSCFGSGSTANYRLNINPTTANFIACTPQLSTGDVTPGTTKNLGNIGLKAFWPAWFQTTGAGMYSFGIIQSRIPTTAINKNLIISPDDVVVTHSTTINTGGGQISERPNPWKALSYSVLPNYDYNLVFNTLAATADRTSNTGTLGTPSRSHNDPTKPHTDVVVYHFTGANAKLAGNWTNINFPVIILADNDLEISNAISGGNISLGADGFLYIMAKGNINISPDIGSDDPADTTAHLEGFFAAGFNVRDGGGTKRLNINGSVSAGFLGTVSNPGTYDMQRNFANVDHNRIYPTNSVIFNGKLFLNTPPAISESKYEWHEVRD